MDAFEENWDDDYPQIAKSWRNNWDNLSTFFGYPPAIRKAIYTTNAIESLNSVIRKAHNWRVYLDKVDLKQSRSLDPRLADAVPIPLPLPHLSLYILAAWVY